MDQALCELTVHPFAEVFSLLADVVTEWVNEANDQSTVVANNRSKLSARRLNRRDGESMASNFSYETARETNMANNMPCGEVRDDMATTQGEDVINGGKEEAGSLRSDNQTHYEMFLSLSETLTISEDSNASHTLDYGSTFTSTVTELDSTIASTSNLENDFLRGDVDSNHSQDVASTPSHRFSPSMPTKTSTDHHSTPPCNNLVAEFHSLNRKEIMTTCQEYVEVSIEKVNSFEAHVSNTARTNHFQWDTLRENQSHPYHRFRASKKQAKRRQRNSSCS
jgi:hypothetical protein